MLLFRLLQRRERRGAKYLGIPSDRVIELEQKIDP